MTTQTQEIINTLHGILKEATKLNTTLDRLLSDESESDTHEYLTGVYDWNIYVKDYSTLTVSAYPLITDSDGDVVQTDSSKWVSLYLPMNSDYSEVIAYLLEDENWKQSAWEDHDAWVAEDFLTCAEAPAIVQAFVKSVNQLTVEQFDYLAKENQNKEDN